MNIASTSARQPDDRAPTYGPAKAALVNLSKQLANVYSGRGVLTNCVCPGITRTEAAMRAAVQRTGRTGDDPRRVFDEYFGPRRPLPAGRFGEPEDTAALVALLCSELAAWVTGACFDIDGGWVKGHWLGFPTLTLVAPDGSRRRELVTTTGYFAWSPRGDALAFTNRGISIVQVGGGKLRHLVATPEGTVVGSLSWSPDGGSIVFQSGDLDVVDLCRVFADGTTLTQLAGCMPNNNGHDLSSDGQTVVFVQSTGPDCDHSPDSRIVVVPLNGGPMSVLAQEGRSPQWLGG